MTAHLDRVERPDELPGQWDTLATDYYQQREFLGHCQTYNPCRQRYYLHSENGRFLAGAVMYTLRLDLFTYLGIRSPVTMNIIGVPASVSSSGLVGETSRFGPLLSGILRAERGLIACLNLDSLPAGSPMFVGRTWPAIILENRFSRWDDYLASLRSPYRRRTLRILRDAADYEMRRRPCSEFTDEMHALYLDVFNRSQGKLERLGSGFFKNLPGRFCLTTYSAAGKVRGWTITLSHGSRFYFFLGGQDYSHEPEKLYLVKLLDIVKAGIDRCASSIDLGQSAETSKVRLGGRPYEKIMLAYHDRVVPRALLRGGMSVLSYHRRVPDAHVFKESAP